MEAALRVFAQKGYSRATNRDIARAAGITTGLIYHYFESKEALLKAIIDAHSPVQLIRSVSSEMLALPPEALLRLLLQQMLGILEDEESILLFRVFLPEAIYNPNVSPLGTAAIQEVTRFVEGYLAAKMELGELRRTDAALAAQVLTGSLVAFVLLRQILHDPAALQYTHEQIVDSVVTLGLVGLVPH
jgi:AcrR family transcriptional regulator